MFLQQGNRSREEASMNEHLSPQNRCTRWLLKLTNRMATDFYGQVMEHIFEEKSK